MQVACPHGWERVLKIGNLTLKDPTVDICGGVCAAPDACGIESCEFYDITPDGTKHFLKTMAHEHTLEGLMEKLSGATPQRRQKPSTPTYTEHWEDFDASFDELAEKGFIEQAGSKDGEPQYRLTGKGLENLEQMERAKRN